MPSNVSIRQSVFALPWYDTHCHMACNEAVGLNSGAFACDCVRGLQLPPLDLWALLTSAYMKWMATTVGEDLDVTARKAGHPGALQWARTDPKGWWNSNWKLYRRLATTGVSKALVRGIKELHGFDLRFEPDSPIVEINERIQQTYKSKGFYAWWREAFSRLNCVKGVKLVEMPYYDSPPANESLWMLEQWLVTTALRVDSFTTLHLPPERVGFRLKPERIGIKANSLPEYLHQVDQALERALAGGMRALKNACAYFDSLQLPPPDDIAAERYINNGNPEDYRAFESAVLRHLLEWCNERNMPYQMHAGIASIPWCNAEKLVEQIRIYPQVRFILLHIYPYVREAGCLARIYPNVYLDPCWLSIVAPEALRNALREWIGFVPPEKMLFGVDATTVEEWYGGALIAKEILTEVLDEKVARGDLTKTEAYDIARQLLHDSAASLYGQPV